MEVEILKATGLWVFGVGIAILLLILATAVVFVICEWLKKKKKWREVAASYKKKLQYLNFCWLAYLCQFFWSKGCGL